MAMKSCTDPKVMRRPHFAAISEASLPQQQEPQLAAQALAELQAFQKGPGRGLSSYSCWTQRGCLARQSAPRPTPAHAGAAPP